MSDPNPNRIASRLAGVRKVLLEFCKQQDEGAMPGELLVSLAKTFPDPGPELARLAAFEEDSRIQEAATLLLFAAFEDDDTPRQLALRLSKSVPPVLLEVLRNKELPDDRKVSLAPLIQLSGYEISRAELTSYFNDFEAACREHVARDSKRLEDTCASVWSELEGASVIPSDEASDQEGPARETIEEALQFGSFVCEHNPGAGVPFLATTIAVGLERGVDSEALLAGLEAVADYGKEAGAWYLQELAQLPAAGELGEAARNHLLQLKGSGHAPRAPLANEFSHGWVTTVDGAGYRALALYFRTPEGTMELLWLMFSDRTGIAAMHFLFGDLDDIQEMLEMLSPLENIRHAHCNLTFARKLVCNALWLHHQRSAPVPGVYLLLRHYLGQEPLVPEPHAPNLGAYMPETIVRGPHMAADSAALMEDEVYASLLFEGPAAQTLMKELLARKAEAKAAAEPGGAGRKRAKGGRRRRPAFSPEELARFIQEAALKERALLGRRMAENLELESLAGRAKKSANRLAARTWVALSEEDLEFAGIPYVQALCHESMRQMARRLWKRVSPRPSPPLAGPAGQGQPPDASGRKGRRFDPSGPDADPSDGPETPGDVPF